MILSLSKIFQDVLRSFEDEPMYYEDFRWPEDLGLSLNNPALENAVARSLAKNVCLVDAWPRDQALKFKMATGR